MSGDHRDLKVLQQPIPTRPLSDLVRLEDINSNIRRYVPLDRRNKKNIHLDNRSVLLTVPVEENTENTLKIPVEILNNKDDYEVTLVPSEINVTYYVPLSRYTEVDPEDFRITAELDER